MQREAYVFIMLHVICFMFHEISMTIVQPNQTKLTAMNIMLVVMIATLAATAIFGMFLYNQLVNFRHDISTAKDAVSKAEVQNAEFKNEIYEMTNIGNPIAFAEAHAMVLDRNPRYLHSAAELAAE